MKINEIKDCKDPIIHWQKWEDPFDNEEVQAVLEKLKGGEDGETEETAKPVAVITHPVFGIVPVTNHLQPGKTFNFWIGYTNFKITYEIGKIIEETLGVEVLEFLSPYRFRVGIGHLFQDRNVFGEIQAAIKKKRGKGLLKTVIAEIEKAQNLAQNEDESTKGV